MSDIIGTDHPLTPEQQATLTAFLDTLIPPSDDGNLPGAGTLSLTQFMHNPLNPEFADVVQEALSVLGDGFAAMNPVAQAERVTAFSNEQAALFSQVYLQALALYYRQDNVLRAIGSGEGAPFPRGNEVTEGDLNLLDAVIAKPKPYRPA